MEITKIYSVLGLVDQEHPLKTERPFREVHHTVSRAALIGGGMIPVPGEISLAHGGVLFLDELAEFQKPVLESLRQPLEEKRIRLSRRHGNYEFPADFMLVAAMNPCACGNYPDPERCRCIPSYECIDGDSAVGAFLQAWKGGRTPDAAGICDITLDGPYLSQGFEGCQDHCGSGGK